MKTPTLAGSIAVLMLVLGSCTSAPPPTSSPTPVPTATPIPAPTPLRVLATVDFGFTTPPSMASIDPQQNSYTIWQHVVTVGTRTVSLQKFALRQIGEGKLQNFRLLVDGIQIAVVAGANKDGYVDFNDPPNPANLNIQLGTGNRMIKIIADVVGEAGKTFQFSLQSADDVTFVDSAYGVRITPTVNGATFSARATGVQSLNSGVVTTTKSGASPVGTISNGPGITLAVYKITARGEPMELRNLSVIFGINSTIRQLKNCSLWKANQQITAASPMSVAGPTLLAFNTPLLIPANTSVEIGVRADVQGFTNGDTLQITLATGTSNATGKDSGGIFNVPAADQSGNTLTISP